MSYATDWKIEGNGESAQDEQHEAPLVPMLVSTLIKSYPALRPPIIEGICREGETMNLIAAQKTGKSWLSMDLGLAVALGRCWLGQFPTHPGNVLLIDNELHQNTIANRLPKIAQARNVLLSELGERFKVLSLRGRLMDLYKIGRYFSTITPGQFRLIILDSFYRFIPSDHDENSNAQMAGLYNLLDSYADRLGCAFVCIHHSSKGNQSQKSVTDVGSGAGAMSRATDSHLVLRQHADDDVVVLDAAVRSWPPVSPLCLRWTLPVWNPAPDLDPLQLRNFTKPRRPAAEKETPEVARWTLERFTTALLAKTPKTRNSIIIAADEAGLSERKAAAYLTAGVESGKIHCWKARKRTEPDRFATVAPTLTDCMEGKP